MGLQFTILHSQHWEQRLASSASTGGHALNLILALVAGQAEHKYK